MKKKLFALAATTVLTFASCSLSNDSFDTSTPESSTETPESSAEVVIVTVEDWFESNPEEVEAMESELNSDTGIAGLITVKLNAKGDVLIYEYWCDELINTSLMTEDAKTDLDAGLQAVVEKQRSDFDDVFTAFEQDYGIKMEAICCVFYNADGTELYTGEIANN